MHADLSEWDTWSKQRSAVWQCYAFELERRSAAVTMPPARIRLLLCLSPTVTHAPQHDQCNQRTTRESH